MSNRTTKWMRAAAAAAVLAFGWGLNRATAGLPDLPLAPPPVKTVPPPINEPPPINTPPGVSNTPEPATLVLGLIGAGIGGMVARRRRRA